MKQSDAVKFLHRDMTIVVSHLVLQDYDQVFEEEMQEYFPFNDTIMEWLNKLYTSEKYSAFDEDKLSIYYEKDHPFLFVRDLAHMNSWNMGHRRPQRQDHITGLMFSSHASYALEATFCLCRPSMIGKATSSWFDFKQAMTNLEKAEIADWSQQAWKACAMFFLYFHLSDSGQSISRDDLVDLLSPYKETLEIAAHEGSRELRKECAVMSRMIGSESTRTMMDGLQL